MQRLSGIKFDGSPNYSVRRDRAGVEYDVTGLVIHYTAGLHSVGWMKNPDAKVSAHFLVDRDGTTTQLVDLDMAAWHAGSSVMPYRGKPIGNPNLFTVGIELENVGMVAPDPAARGKFLITVGNAQVPYKLQAPPIQGDLHFENGHTVSGWWEPFYEPQMLALEKLIAQLKVVFPGIASNIYGHNEIAVPQGRKIDPGMFDWARIGRDPATLKVRQVLPAKKVV